MFINYQFKFSQWFHKMWSRLLWLCVCWYVPAREDRQHQTGHSTWDLPLSAPTGHRVHSGLCQPTLWCEFFRIKIHLVFAPYPSCNCTTEHCKHRGFKTQPQIQTLQKDDIQNAVDGLYNDVLNKQCMLNVEYRSGSQEFVSLLYSDNKEDVAQGLISEGLLLVENRREKRLAKLMEGYRKAQDKAKAARVSDWDTLLPWAQHYHTICLEQQCQGGDGGGEGHYLSQHISI